MRLGYINILPKKLTECSYCKKALTDAEINDIKETDIRSLCTKHNHSDCRSWLQSDFAFKWLKYKDENPTKDWSKETDKSEFMSVVIYKSQSKKDRPQILEPLYLGQDKLFYSDGAEKLVTKIESRLINYSASNERNDIIYWSKSDDVNIDSFSGSYEDMLHSEPLTIESHNKLFINIPKLKIGDLFEKGSILFKVKAIDIIVTYEKGELPKTAIIYYDGLDSEKRVGSPL
jgi:hypothetical protein